MKLKCSSCGRWLDAQGGFHRNRNPHSHLRRAVGWSYTCVGCRAEIDRQTREEMKARSEDELAADTPETKLCPDCGVQLPASAFSLNRSRRSGLQTYCREHQAERRRRWTTHQRADIFRRGVKTTAGEGR